MTVTARAYGTPSCSPETRGLSIHARRASQLPPGFLPRHAVRDKERHQAPRWREVSGGGRANESIVRALLRHLWTMPVRGQLCLFGLFLERSFGVLLGLLGATRALAHRLHTSQAASGLA